MLPVDKEQEHTQTWSMHTKLLQRPYNNKDDYVFGQKCKQDSTNTLFKFTEVIKHTQYNVTHKDETQMIVTRSQYLM
jgi:hypothetical protein